jgi:DNA polymerase
MADPAPDRPQLTRLVRQQLAALHAAGIEYLPTHSDEPLFVPAAPAAPVESIPPPEPASPAPSDAADAAIPPADELSPDDRRRELKVLSESVAACTRCSDLVRNRTHTVFGVGPIDVELCLIGEGPGQEEDRRGEPFVGAAGQLLNRIIAACGFQREEVYICNIVKCQPPRNRQPLPDEAANCRAFLDRQLDLVRPKFICALGATAVQNLLGTSMGITRLRGSFQEYRGIPVMCTFHPAYLLRTPEKKREVWEDMKKLLQRMGRPIPAQAAK